MRKVNADFAEKLAALIASMGYELLGCEFTQQNRRTIFRIYIDQVGGVSHQDCSKVSYQVSAMLDVDDPIQGQYVLEVSSPGIDRPLFSIGQYQQQLGQRLKIRLYAPIGQRRNYVGVLQRVENGQIYLLLDEGTDVALPFSEIEKANVIADLSSKIKGGVV